jgi:hypothetical protein
VRPGSFPTVAALALAVACTDPQHRKLAACCDSVGRGPATAEAQRLCAARPPNDAEGADQLRTHIRQAYFIANMTPPRACVRIEDTLALPPPQPR